MRRSAALAATGGSSDEALEHFLDLRVLDPAMGSGHFLVSAAAFIAQYIATDPSYQGDLSLIELQRLVAERCLYGVDLNPMAVELAQLSLWLTTVQRGEPLTFLHNLRVGNSLVGAELSRLLDGETTLFAERLGRDARELLAQIDAIEHEASHSGEQVHEKERLAGRASALREPLERYADEMVAPSFPGGAGRFLHWELEFPEVFLSLDGGMRDDRGFDAIVGNPPYVRIQELGRELAAYCRREYATASGSFDVYVPFLERGIRLLSRGGRLGFILPNKLLKLEFGQRLRELLASESLVEEIVDFGDAQLFAGATNYTCILVLDRGGTSTFAYRRVRGGPGVVRQALVNLDILPAEEFSAGDFGGDPWVLATGDEARVLRAVTVGSERLGDVTGHVFTGLQTSADDVFIVRDCGTRGAGRVVRSRASDRELELEPDLLHPLASGSDVGRYAFEPLESLLLFPYVREAGGVRLISRDELARLPLTEAYLLEHEDRLRGREGRRMDHDGWWAFGRTQSLGAHDRPKLGVAATVRRLEVAADLAGGVYFHNVRVNGILGRQGGLPLAALVTLLNSRLLDWVFRRGAAPHAGGHYAANKQFIAPLPIRLPDPAASSDLERLGERLQAGAGAVAAERRGFVDWLGDAVGARTRELPGSTILRDFDQHAPAELLAVLGRRRGALATDPGTRTFRELLVHEHTASVERLVALRADLAADERTADDAVYELYGLDAAARALVDAEYASA